MPEVPGAMTPASSSATPLFIITLRALPMAAPATPA